MRCAPAWPTSSEADFSPLESSCGHDLFRGRRAVRQLRRILSLGASARVLDDAPAQWTTARRVTARKPGTTDQGGGPRAPRRRAVSPSTQSITQSTKSPTYPHIVAVKTVSYTARARVANRRRGWAMTDVSDVRVKFPRGSQGMFAVGSSGGNSRTKDCFSGNGNRMVKARQWKSSANLLPEPHRR